jgi:hypothetical protein
MPVLTNHIGSPQVLKLVRQLQLLAEGCEKNTRYDSTVKPIGVRAREVMEQLMALQGRKIAAVAEFKRANLVLDAGYTQAQLDFYQLRAAIHARHGTTSDALVTYGVKPRRRPRKAREEAIKPTQLGPTEPPPPALAAPAPTPPSRTPRKK